MSEHDYSIPTTAKEGKPVKAPSLKPTYEQLQEWLNESHVTIHNQIVAMQCVYIDAYYGRGAHHAIDTWLTNYLACQGFIPEDSAGPYSKNAQEWQDETRQVDNPNANFPRCWCGKGSCIVGNHKGTATGWCCEEHYRQSKNEVATFPKPQKIIVPMSRIRALLPFVDKASACYQGYIIFQVDNNHNFLVTAYSGAISAQYQPGDFDASCIIENIPLFGLTLQYIVDSSDFKQLELIRGENGKWVFYQADCELHLTPLNTDRLPTSLPFYLTDIIASPTLSDEVKATYHYDQQYLDLLPEVAKLLGDGDENASHVIHDKSFMSTYTKTRAPLVFVTFDHAPDFKAVIAPRLNKEVNSRA